MRQLQNAELLLSITETLTRGLLPPFNQPQDFSSAEPSTSAQIPQEENFNNNDTVSPDPERDLYRRLKFKLHRTKPHQTAAANFKHRNAGTEAADHHIRRPAPRLTEVSLSSNSSIFFAK